MRNFGKLAATAAAMLLCFSASQAFADLVFVRSAITGSYQADFQLNSGTFNNIHVVVPSNFSAIGFPLVVGGSPTFSGQLEASAFTTPANTTFVVPTGEAEAAAGWGGYTLTGTTVLDASGGSFAASLANPFDFGLKFSNNITDGTTFDAVFRNGSTFVRGFHVSYYQSPDGLDRYQIVEFAVPLPSAAWAGLATLAGMGAFLVKRRRNRAILD